MFEKASRLKVRFETPKGNLQVEDLWDLPLTSKIQGRPNLDDIARGLHKQLKNDDDVSFVEKDRKSDELIQLKFDIVKHIIEKRLVENEMAAQAKDRAEQKQLLLSIIAQKEGEQLSSMSIEDLRKKIAELT